MCLATPILAEPLSLGADDRIIPRQKPHRRPGRCLGGIILSSEAFSRDIHNFMRQTGPSMSPFNALGAAEGFGDAWRSRRAQAETAGTKVAEARQPSKNLAAESIPAAADHPQAALVRSRCARLDAHWLRGQGGKRQAAFAASSAADLADRPTSRRCKEPRHPSRHHDASTG